MRCSICIALFSKECRWLWVLSNKLFSEVKCAWICWYIRTGLNKTGIYLKPVCRTLVLEVWRQWSCAWSPVYDWAMQQTDIILCPCGFYILDKLTFETLCSMNASKFCEPPSSRNYWQASPLFMFHSRHPKNQLYLPVTLATWLRLDFVIWNTRELSIILLC